MSESMVGQIARAVLYEGYILYPYRPSVKNRQRWTFGGIFPRAYIQSHPGSDPDSMQTQCLISGNASAKISIKLRFLHLTDRVVEQAPNFDRIQSLRIGNREYQTWQEASEREVVIDNVSVENLKLNPRRTSFSFPHVHAIENLYEGDRIAGRLVRKQQELEGEIALSARAVSENLTELTARIVNLTPINPTLHRERAILSAFASTHLILAARSGEFISLTDPPGAMREAAGECENIGCWPVLVGEANQTDTLLVSPIILPDYPQIAPESPGDLFDGCEIDEILTLRIMTLTDAEKEQAAAVDDRVRQMLQRTDALARDQLMNLHGTIRGLRPVAEEKPMVQEQQHV